MPITSSAKKALRVSRRKRVFNIRSKASYEEVIKKIKKLVKENKIKEAVKELPLAYKAIDKACKTDILKKNTASRKKSRLTVFVNKALKTK